MKQIPLGSVLDLENLRKMVEERYISVKKHPTEDLYILDYSPQAQYAEMWNDETMTCRGLIVRAPDGPFAPTATIHARPFRKFFNASQHVPLDAAPLRGNGTRAFTPGPLPVGEPFEVFAKMDGSMGVLSMIAGEPTITTRGSFSSEQAVWATEYFREHHAHVSVPEDVTYIFEIVAKWNQIVVRYDFEGLVFLAAIDNETGADLPVPADWDGPVVERYDFSDFSGLSALVDANPEEYYNSEGFVVRFQSGVRAKLKFAEYVRLHRIVTGVSTKTAYQHLGVSRLREDFDDKAIGRALGMPPEEVANLRRVADPVQSLIDECPDEMFDWLDGVLQGFEKQIEEIVSDAQALFDTLPQGDRKAAASIVSASSAHKGVVFKMLDGRPFLDLVFKDIRPQFAKAYKVDADS